MNKKIILLLVVICMMFIGKVNAKSTYYEKIWENASENEGYYEVISSLDVESGFLVGGSERTSEPFIHRHDYNGNLIESIALDPSLTGVILKIMPEENGYFAFGISEDKVYIIKIDEDYKVISFKEYEANLYGDNYLPTFVERIDDFVYIFNVNYGSSNVVRYSIEDDYFSNVDPEEVDAKAAAILDNYYDILKFDDCKGKNQNNPNIPDEFANYGSEYSIMNLKNADDNYCSSFVEPYNDGYMFGLFDNDHNISKMIYYKNQEVVWEKLYAEESIFDGIQYNDKFLFISYKNEDLNGSEILTLIDKDGKNFETEIISEYIEIKKAFGFTDGRLHRLNSGFMLSGIEDICNPANQMYGKDNEAGKIYGELAPPTSCSMNGLLYFESIYKVIVKENEHGKITVNKVRSPKGGLIEVTTEVDEDYKIDKIVVTDINGVAVEFKDNKFTMPASDVTIELVLSKNVTVVEKVAEDIVDNPVTATGVGVGLIVLLVISGYYFFKHKKDLTY